MRQDETLEPGKRHTLENQYQSADAGPRHPPRQPEMNQRATPMVAQNRLEDHFLPKNEIIPVKVTIASKTAANHLSGAPSALTTKAAASVAKTMMTCSQLPVKN